MDNQNILIQAHFAELYTKYSGLTLDRLEGTSIVHGLLEFIASYKGVDTQDSFHIKLLITKDYHKTPPVAKEIGGRIPKDFHTNPDGSLCLAMPTESRLRFSQNPTLIGFVEDLLIPYLFSFSYWQKNGVMPYGAFSHGPKGIMEYYLEFFKIGSESIVLNFLKILVEGHYRGKHKCPCGSGLNIRQCHEKALLKLNSFQNQVGFINDFLQCADYLKEKSDPKWLRRNN